MKTTSTNAWTFYTLCTYGIMERLLYLGLDGNGYKRRRRSWVVSFVCHIYDMDCVLHGHPTTKCLPKILTVLCMTTSTSCICLVMAIPGPIIIIVDDIHISKCSCLLIRVYVTWGSLLRLLWFGLQS